MIVCKGVVRLWCESSESDLPWPLDSLLIRILTKFLHEEKIFDPPLAFQERLRMGTTRESILNAARMAGGLLKYFQEDA